MSFFDETTWDIDIRVKINWKSTLLNNPFLCGRLLEYIIVMQPYPQIV